MTSSSPRGKDVLAIAGSLVLPGLGHVFSRAWVRGLVWFFSNLLLTGALVLVLAVPRFLPGLVVLAPLTLIAAIALCVDACLVARRAPRPLLTTPAKRYIVAAAILVLGLLLSPGTLLTDYIHRHYIHAYNAASGSMAPTIREGERFFSRPLGRHTIRRWDIIVYRPSNRPETPMVKRIAGLPGETLEIKSGQVWINGAAVPPPAGVPPFVETTLGLKLSHSHGCEGNPIKLGPGEYFILGDRSDKSADSRNTEWGTPGSTPGAITTTQFEGVVSAIYWPPSRWRRFE